MRKRLRPCRFNKIVVDECGARYSTNMPFMGFFHGWYEVDDEGPPVLRRVVALVEDTSKNVHTVLPHNITFTD